MGVFMLIYITSSFPLHGSLRNYLLVLKGHHTRKDPLRWMDRLALPVLPTPGATPDMAERAIAIPQLFAESYLLRVNQTDLRSGSQPPFLEPQLVELGFS